MSCKICRARKVKCDGRPNGCANCERLGFDCDTAAPASASDDSTGRSQVASSTATTTAPVVARKIRTYRSCSSCRASKTKCTGDRPVCLRCRERGLPCVYDATKSRPSWAKVLSRETREDFPEDGTQGSQDASAGVSGNSGSSVGDAVDVGLGRGHGLGLGLPVDAGSGLASPVLGSGATSGLQTPQSTMDPQSGLSWLTAPTIPSSTELRRKLAEQYFTNVHPLRCFAFVHKPSFMQQLDRGFDVNVDENSALLHMILAHGAKFFALEHRISVPSLPTEVVQLAGNEWAKIAEGMILTSYGKVSIPNLMAAILLYDYQYRLGNYAHALMISGLTTRMAHAIQLNLELPSSGEESAVAIAYRESRRRLMWSCYILDAWTGSGIDQPTLLHESDIQVQLPCNERCFLLRIPCVTPRLDYYEATYPRSTENTGMAACYIHLIAIWKRIVRYVKDIDATNPPWLPDSEFARLRAAMHAWRDGLPSSFQYSAESVYIRLESSQLGALALMHCTYHNAMCDLHRIAMPELFKLRNTLTFPAPFREHLQLECLHHSREIAETLGETARRGLRHLADSLLPSFAYNSSRVMLYCVARVVDPRRPYGRDVIDETLRLVQGNNSVLKDLAAMMPLADPLYVIADRWLTKVRTSFANALGTSHSTAEKPDVQKPDWTNTSSTPTSSTPDTPNPLSLYRHAHKETLAPSPRSLPRHPPPKPQPHIPPVPIIPTTIATTIPEAPTSNPQWTMAPTPNPTITIPVPNQTPQLHRQQILNPVQGVSPLLPDSGTLPMMSGQGISLDLDDLQYYLAWGFDGVNAMGDDVMDDSGMATWFGVDDQAPFDGGNGINL